MDFKAALRFPFHYERWGMNLLMIAVCFFIPMVGPIVLLGYGVMVLRTLISGGDQSTPEFNFSNFGKYLERGIMPFVAALIQALILVPLMWAAMFVFMFGLAIIANGRGGEQALGIVMMIVGAILYMLLIVGFSILTIPLMLKVELEGKLAGAFDFRFALDFFKRVGGQTILMILGMMGIGLLAMPIGLLMCIVGVYAMAAVLFQTQWHLRAQLYRMYLERGGTAIAVPEEQTAAGFQPIIEPPQSA